MKIFLRTTLFALCLTLTQRCLAEPAPPKIGVISGLSGAAAKWNRYQNMGIELAREELAADGFPIELLYEDSATNSPKAISAYNKLFDLDKVDAVLANDFGFAIAPILPLVARQQRFMVAISLPHERYCKEAPGYFYSATSQFFMSQKAFERFFELNPQVKRIALVIFDDPEWGNTYREIWTELAHKRGVEILETYLNADLEPDMRTPLTRIIARNPDAIFFAHEPETFLKAAHQLGYKGIIVSANSVFEVVADSEKPRWEVENVYTVDPLISEEFHQKFVKRFGRPPILEAYAGYEALRAMANAFKLNPKHPEKGMRRVEYSGVAGEIDYTGESCAGNMARWGLYQFKNGKPKLL